MLEVAEVSVRFGGIVALDDLSFTMDRGQICGLIGPNGAGKTTLFNVVSRIYDPTWGAVRFEDKNLLDVPAYGIAGRGVARTFQNLALFPTMTVLDNVMIGATTRSKTNWVTAALRIGAEREDRRLRQEAMEILAELDLARHALHPATGLPYGTLKRIELARAMAARPRLLLLDEPASGLTHSEVDELAGTIRFLRDKHQLTVLLVEHHMQMVMAISDKVVVLNFGRKIAEGTPAEVSSDPHRHRGIPGGTHVTEPVLTVTDLKAAYGPVSGAARPRLRGERRRGRRAARCERCRQDHHSACLVRHGRHEGIGRLRRRPSAWGARPSGSFEREWPTCRRAVAPSPSSPSRRTSRRVRTSAATATPCVPTSSIGSGCSHAWPNGARWLPAA